MFGFKNGNAEKIFSICLETLVFCYNKVYLLKKPAILSESVTKIVPFGWSGKYCPPSNSKFNK
jgi:hypothetical protein